jgi:uncharacterized protein YdhG (YjbR/CyaY superfamily)
MTKYKTIDKYIESFPKEVQDILQKIRTTIQETAPDAKEAMTYGMPTFKLNGKNLVHFAAYKSHIGFYPTPNGLDEFEEELKEYRSGKGTAKFSLEVSIPYDLIKRITQFRVEQIKNKKS